MCFLLFASLTACKDTKWEELLAGTPPEDAVTGKPGEMTDNEEPVDPSVPDVPATHSFINSSYIRGDYFDFERISKESMAACTDLIYLSPRPYADGELAFDLPVNDATFSGGVTHLSSFQNRSGVIKFDGTGTMNGGDGLIQTADYDYTNRKEEGAKTFTFGTYLYIDTWVNSACLFKKMNGTTEIISLKLGTSANTLQLAIDGAGASATSAALTAGAWHHVAVTYDKGTAKLIVDGGTAVTFSGGTLPAEVPNTRADLLIGENFKGYLDETYVSSVAASVGTGELSFSAGNWNSIKVLAYWKYSDASAPGKDSHTWLGRLEGIRNALAAQTGNIKLRIGVAGGHWKDMAADATARTNFARNIKALIDTYRLDGVDLDFEWPTGASEFADYSAMVLKLREVLGSGVCFTVSLHPVAFRISPEAIAAVDFISYQCYGPAVMRFPFSQFVTDAEAALAYGIPKEKLVMGVPFYGSTGSATTGYYNLVVEQRLSDATLDNFAGYTFNGQKTIREKTQYVCQQGLAGIMSWDLATDVDITHPKSLLKAVQEELDNYVPAPAAE